MCLLAGVLTIWPGVRRGSPVPPTVVGMIIESGTDVVQVLCGSVADVAPDGLWIVAMDENLRLVAVEPVSSKPLVEVADPLVDQLLAVEEVLADWPRIAYFALAWSSDVDLDRDGEWLRRLDESLRDRDELASARLLGIVVFDRTTVFASLPRCDFGYEADFDDLPRAVVIAGPHGPACSCPPCTADRRTYDDFYDGALDDPDLVDHPFYDSFSRRWFPEPERAHKRWTTDEEATIAQSHFSGLSCFDISMLVHRQPGAVAARLNKLGISSRTYLPERDYPGSVLPTDALPGQSPPDR